MRRESRLLEPDVGLEPMQLAGRPAGFPKAYPARPIGGHNRYRKPIRDACTEVSDPGRSSLAERGRPWKNPKKVGKGEGMGLTFHATQMRTVRAYLLKESFQGLWQFVRADYAGIYLDGWIGRAMRSRLEPVKKVARSLRRHRKLILNWFEAAGAYSAGIVEGFNNKVKLTIRKAYGYKQLRAAEVALYHALGQLPEPELTHEFC